MDENFDAYGKDVLNKGKMVHEKIEPVNDNLSKNRLIFEPSDIDNSIDKSKTIVSSDLLFNLALKELQKRRSILEAEISELEERRKSIQKEISKNSLSQSDAIARKLKGFQDYLIGALQDLTASAEQIELRPKSRNLEPSLLDKSTIIKKKTFEKVAAGAFSVEEAFIRQRLQKLLHQPNKFSEAWKLRRVLDKETICLIEDWFFNQGGRGSQTSYGSRNRDILATSAIIAVLGELYGDRFQTLILAKKPEQLGEWRRGLQDCLGLTRKDFGPSGGVMLFEASNILIERADQLENQSELPFIVFDTAEQIINTSILQFPLFLAFTKRSRKFMKENE